MLFNSFEYLELLSVTFICILIAGFFKASGKIKVYLLLLASAHFYISWSWQYYLMLLSIVFSIFFAGKHLKENKPLMITLVTALLSSLAYFKYTNFFIENINDLLGADSFTFISVILPLGISFYVFQLIAYVVDLYKGETEHETSLPHFALFVTFFPQLIAGPICRTTDLLPQIKQPIRTSLEHLYDGIILLMGGLCLKVVFADGIAPFVDVIFSNPREYSGFDNAMAALGFGLQIFSDFCGYSLMALGSAKLFGIHIPYNFNLPYAATSIQAFWRKWHITLSQWLRDYLYIPLGGNRSNTLATCRNLLITMLLGGFWHGASWNFIVWGAIHGVALILSRMVPLRGLSLKLPPWLIISISWALTMSVVFAAWIFFRAQGLDNAFILFSQIFTGAWDVTRLSYQFFELVLLFVPIHYLIHKACYEVSTESFGRRFAPIIIPLLLLLILIYYADSNDFIYFQF